LIGSITVLLIVLFYGYIAKRKLTSLLKDKNRQLKEYNDRLQQSKQELQEIIDAKNKLFSVVAHDLRNPVATLKGFSELLLDKIHDLENQTIQVYSRQIHESAFRTYALLENLLLWAQSQMQALKVNISEIRIYDVIKDSSFTISTSLDKKNIDFEFNCDEELTAVADDEMIKVVIRNLLSNAVKFTYPGGKVTVNAFSKNNSAIIEVSDTGVGMDEKMLQKIFSSNLIISSVGTDGETGSGLGLLLCKDFTKKNNGSLTVESEPDVGTTFRLILPVEKSTV
jgi:two-component system sensor histidine kinase/response regulator